MNLISNFRLYFLASLIFHLSGAVLAADSPFQLTYFDQREHFLAVASQLQKSAAAKWNVSFEELAVTSGLVKESSVELNGKLQTDLVWIKARSPQKKLVVISSGLHGVEGFVGSAVQSDLVREILSQSQTSESNHQLMLEHDLLLVHVVNPWGMQNKRRVNEQNVDLNRNFDDPNLTSQLDFSKYQSIDPFLNPQTPFHEHLIQKGLFLFDSLYYILKFGMGSVRQAILQGQYQQPKGIYFGGQNLQPESLAVQDLAGRLVKNYEKILWIDLHTGYGQRGKLHLLVDPEPPQNLERLQKIFLQHPPEPTHQGQFYRTTGDLISFLVRAYPDQITGVVFEYGTLDSQKTLGSIESLRRMVAENQNFFWGPRTENSKSTHEFFDMFAPLDPAWWKMVRDQNDTAFKEVLQNFK